MEAKKLKIISRYDRSIAIGALPGHFATNHSHVNHYVDITDLKTRFSMAKSGARVLASKFSSTPVDTILCLEGTNVVGAFLAQELSKNQAYMSYGNDICVITPESNANNQFLFRDNTQGEITGKNVLLLLASVSTGKTIRRSLDCLQYYQGNMAGIAALFSAAESVEGIHVESIFSTEDLPAYRSFRPNECELCKSKVKVDAIANSFGYSKI